MALWRLGVILNQNVPFLSKTPYFFFHLLQLFKQVLSGRIGEAGQNVPLSYNCANSIGAANLLFNQAMPCKLNIHPANLIRHAYSRYKHVHANTIGILTVSPYWLKFAALRLFVETIPIYKAVATGTGNNEFYREWTHSNVK